MKRFNKERLYSLSIIILILAIFTGFFSYYIYNRQKSHLISDYQSRIKTEIKLINRLITNVMAQDCSVNVNDLLSIWTNGHSDIALLEVILDSGKIIFSYHNSQPDKYEFLLSNTLKCSNNTINLAIAYDSRHLTNTLNELRNNFIVLTISLIVCMGLSLWFTLFRWLVKPMRLEINRHAIVLREMVGYIEDLYNAMSAHTAILDDAGIITSTNKSWQEFAKRNGYHNDPAMVGQLYVDMVAAMYQLNDQISVLKQGIQAVITGSISYYEYEYDCNDCNQQHWFIMRILPVISSKPFIIIATHEDVTKIKQGLLELDRLSTTDKLTQLYNRTKLDNALSEEIKRAQRYTTQSLSIILTDIDHFKKVNDTFGHQAGDSALIQFSKILRENIRNSDIAGRWGGEEFLIICPHTDNTGATQLAEKLRKILAHSNIEIVGNITASFGVAEFLSGDDADKLLGRADRALYKAKDAGRNQVMIAE
jgi:diguanylate cyclase (GGDEF)-like protein